MSEYDHAAGYCDCAWYYELETEQGREREGMLHVMHDAAKFAEGAAKAILEGELHRFEYAGRKPRQGKDCDCDACTDQRTTWIPWVPTRA